MKNASIDFLNGNIERGILKFSIPLILSNLLQIFFNMSDLAVAGHFSGALSLGAVGSSTQLIFFFTGFGIGLGQGVNVITAYYLGGRNKKDLKETVQTSFIISILFGAFLMIVALLTVRPILKLIGTKPELFDEAVGYFSFYATGLPALTVYNFASNSLSATGDTRRPLVYLSIGGVVNIGLNIFFVLVVKMNSLGVGLASSISSYLSMALTVLALLKEKGSIRLETRKLKLNLNKAIQVLKLGLPSGLQNAIFSFANIFIQSGINIFSPFVVAGATVGMNADPFAYESMSAFYAAGATFISQNYGAGNKKRILKSYFLSVLFSFLAGLSVGMLIFIFHKEFILVFTTDSEVSRYAFERIKIMSVSYCISSFMDATISAARGLGKTLLPTIFVISGSCLFRILWVKTVFSYYKTIRSLFLLYSVSWGITSIAEVIYFIKIYREIGKKDFISAR